MDIASPKDTQTPALEAGMIHKDGMKLLLESTVEKDGQQKKATATFIRHAISESMNCDINTGTLHKKRTCQWAELIGSERSYMDASVDFLTELGYHIAERDYYVTGTLPYTAYARATLEQKARMKRKIANGRDALSSAIDFFRAEKVLRELYGFSIATLATPSKIMEAAKALLSTAQLKYIQKKSSPKKPAQRQETQRSGKPAYLQSREAFAKAIGDQDLIAGLLGERPAEA